MNYQLEIRDHNIKPHLDIEEEVRRRINDTLTFTIRVNNGNIVGLNITEYVNAKQKYGIITGLVIEEYTATYYPRKRSETDPLGVDNIHGESDKRDSTSSDTKHSETEGA